ncbi:MAG: MATE family efflux transporter [Lachnospiraceae bacterium]|nr:MATE family efflux transporter [Lachnospiraceae bacterium]
MKKEKEMTTIKQNPLARKYNLISMLLFTLPNIIMMIFMSLYTIVDGIFVSRYVGTTALACINIIYPVSSIQLAIAVMLATGGSAIIAMRMGQGKTEEARNNFSMIVLLCVIVGIVIEILGLVFLKQIVLALGASAEQISLCEDYQRILLFFSPAYFLQVAFQTFFVTAGKPHLGLGLTACAGLTNVILDYVFIGVWHMGIEGAAIATVIGYCIPSVVGVCYFFLNRRGNLYFVRPVFDSAMLWKTCTNGSSEMVTNLANAVVTYLFNITCMRYYGEDGVAAITIVLYLQFVFTAIYLGYSMGIAPVISFKYGCGDLEQQKKIFKNSMFFLVFSAVLTYIISSILIAPVTDVFARGNENVIQITAEGYRIYGSSFLIMGINIFASSMFTAYSDGKVSAIISISRTFLFLVIMMILLPRLLGTVGIWLSVPVAELMGLGVSLMYFVRKRQTYHYV